MEQNNKNKILTVLDVNKFFKKRNTLKHALKNINFDVEEGDFFGIIGESGSGKTTLGKSIIRLYDISGGNIYFYDKLISSKKLSKKDHTYVCNNIQMVFQDPMSSLNPKMNILKIISEPLVINKEIKHKVDKLMEKKYKINNVFEYYLLEKIEDIALVKEKTFYKAYLDTINNQITSLKSFKFSNEDDWISSFNEIDNEYNKYIQSMKLNIEELSKMIDEEKNIIKNIFDSTDIDADVKEYINSPKTKYSENYTKALEQYNEAKSKIKEFKLQLKDKAKKEVLKIRVNDYHLQKKYHNDNSKVKFDKISYYFEKILQKHSKACLYSVKKFIGYKHLSVKDIEMEIKFIFEEIDNYFKSVNDRLFNITEANFTTGINDVKKEIESEKINLFLDPMFRRFSDSLERKNKEAKKIDDKRLEELNKELQKAKKELDKQKDSKTKTKDNDKFKKLYDSYKSSYLKKEQDVYKSQREEIIALKKEVKIHFKEMEKLFKKINKKLYSLRPKAIEEFSWKERRAIISKNTKSFKIQIATKNKTFKSIDWEAKNVFDINFINKKLSSKSKFKLWFYKGELVNMLILNKVFNMLESVGLKKEHAYRYPHEFSGGQRQRIVIARALITNPKLIIADEAISALDVSVQAQVINIMKDLCEQKGMTFLFIAHDLSMVQHICNKVIIMHNGSIVEKGLVSEVFKNPVHPYTKSLFMAVPELNKMDVNLAAFDDNSEYEKEYSISNIPKFYKVSPGHEVLASEKQFKEWVK